MVFSTLNSRISVIWNVKGCLFVFRENGADSILDLGLLDSSEKVQVRDVLYMC